MAERVFATISEYGMNLSTLTGASGSLVNLKAIGTQYISSTSNPKRTLEHNYESQLVFNNTDHSSRRGLNVAIFDQDMKLTYMATFDFYGSVNSMVSFVSRMNAVKANEIAVLTSMDAITSNADIDALFATFRSVAWPGESYFTARENNKRSSYVGIFCGKKKHIVAEKFVGNQTPDTNAEIEISFSNPITIGYSGYGEMIISDESTTASIGNSNLVKCWLDKKPIADIGLKISDDILFSALAEIDDIANMTDAHIQFELAYFDSNKAHITSVTKDVYSVEGWELVEIRDKIPFGCVYMSVCANVVQKDGAVYGGTVYAKNVTLQASDNAYAFTSSVSFGLYGTATKRYDDSLGNFGHYDPTGYYKAYMSDDNLIRNIPIKQRSIEPVKWFNRVLDKPEERIVLVTTDNLTASVGPVPIDPKKWYYCCVWLNKQQKSSGTLGLSLSVVDSNDVALELTSTDGTLTAVDMYSQNPPFDMLEDRQWYLVQGFILPSGVDLQKAEEFIERNKEFYGWDDIYGNGIGISDEGTGNYGWINNSQCLTGHLKFSDEDNQTNNSKSLWALPILKELTIGSVDIDDGVLTSISLGS